MKAKPGKRCLICRRRKPYSAFDPPARRCRACANEKWQRRQGGPFERVCSECGADFVTASPRGVACSDECRRKRKRRQVAAARAARREKSKTRLFSRY